MTENELNEVVTEYNLVGSRHRGILEIYYMSVQDRINDGTLKGKQKEKVLELLGSISWTLEMSEKLVSLLNRQSHIISKQDAVIKSLSGGKKTEETF